MSKNKIFTGIIVCIAISAAIWLLVSYKDALDELSYRESNKAVLEKDIHEFRKEADNNRKYLENLRKNPDFQDATARKELGYGAKGERVYRFPQEK
ncbi:MAG: septum formation initiator family protein [Opitutales bacterium]|nr:septum formation initiator family protein [Opitutales bacterium]